MPGYVIIAGHGRSGSNRLLDAFDCHETTNCRNEPNEVPGGVFARLEDGFFESDLRPGFEERWRAAVEAARLRFSGRDRLAGLIKSYHRPIIGRLFSDIVLKRARLRRAFGIVAPRLKSDEWLGHPLHLKSDVLAEALPVFKIVLNQGWMTATHSADDNQRVVHNIRRPKAFLRSWRSRYVAPTGPEKVYANNLATLDRILVHFGEPAWDRRSFSEPALFETELWRWRYVNETLFAALSQSARFTISRYEDFDVDPLDEAKRLFAFAGLAFEPRHAERVSALRNTLFAEKKRAPMIDESAMAEIMHRVLGGSKMIAAVYGGVDALTRQHD